MLPDAMATGGRLSPDHAYPFTGVGLSSEGVEAFEVTTIEATGRLDGRYLERFDTLAAQADTSEGIRMVWG